MGDEDYGIDPKVIGRLAREVIEARDTRTAAVELRSALQAAESSQRGFLVTGNEIYLAPYGTAKAQAERQLAALKRAFAPHPDSAVPVEQSQDLAEFLRQNPGAVTLHAVGHSAGAIFHSYFLRAAFEEGVPAFESFIFLDPAILIEEFKRDIVPRIGNGNGIHALSTFALGKQRALDDECKLLNITFYNKSLLYLVHHALEDEEDAPLLGLQENVEADPVLREMFGGADARVQAIWSPQLAGPLDSRSDAREHAGIDSEPVTMESVARRITGQENIESFPSILT